MSAQDKVHNLTQRARAYGIGLGSEDAAALRRAEKTLHRWAEGECGDGNDYASWSIERDETTGLPYRVTYPHNGSPRRTRIPDREKGALARVAALCAAKGLYYYHQTDPRGCALYISREPLTDNNYSHGLACCD